jgi:DNA mismatch repair protein MutS2
LLEPAREVEELPPVIFRVVDPDGTIRERQLPTLAAIRGRIRRLAGDVDRAARRFFTAPEYRTVVNGDRPTERGGRTVIPVKANHQGRIRGVIHEVSASGATVFIEPEECIRAGHRIAEERLAYRRELRRIMRELTARIAARRHEVEAVVAAVVSYDARYGRARYARLHHCAPVHTGDGEIDLRAARHPLLGAEAVPIDIHWGGSRRVLIVTGPNTGGKTVALKTVGLFALMNHFGMQVPAAPPSVLPWLDQVLCDIGDEQSIAQSLSTFSGHVQQIAHILGSASGSSLVLLDELGAGTDPEEGVTLAMAVLDSLIARGALVAVTTHHGALKNYGYVNPAVENAAMEFDLQSLQPTYRLLMGIPGESHALEIARRQGLDDRIVAAARSYLADGRTDSGEMIRSLTARERELRGVAEQHERSQVELRRRDREAEARDRALAARERELRAAEERDLRVFLRESRSALEGAIRELRERGRSGSEWRAAAAAAREVIEQVAVAAAPAPRPEPASHPVPAGAARRPAPDQSGRAPEALAVGMRVQIAASGRSGEVVRAGRRDTWVVQTGSVRGTFRSEELVPAAAAVPVRTQPVRLDVEVNTTGSRPLAELNVLGLRLDEALAAVQRQVDGALLAGLRQCAIVHGRGEGVLRHGIHQYLERRRDVVEFAPAAHNDGGDGKTIVRLA